SDAWRRAQFFALCKELEDGWQPRSGIERQLLDTMAQAQSGFLHWLAILTQYTTSAMRKADRAEGQWSPPRGSQAEATDQPAARGDRFTRGGPCAFAGLWEGWQGEEGDVQSCSIVTTDANELMRPSRAARRWMKHAAS